MKDIRVLVTGTGGAAGVVCVKSFAKKNIYTLGVNCFSLTAGFKMSDEYAVVPMACEASYIPELLNLCRQKSINMLIPTVDEELIPCAENIDLFKELGVQVSISSASSIRKCLDKWAFFNELRHAGLPVPATWLADDSVDISALPYPVIAKPRTGRGGRGLQIFNCQTGLASFIEKNRNYIIQEYIDGDEYTIDMLSDFDGRFVTAVPRKRTEIKGGVCWKGNTVHSYRMADIAAKIAGVLELKGPTCIQGRMGHDGEMKIFELNPRIGGTASLSIAAGVDFPILTARLLFHEKILPAELVFRKLFISRYFEDVYFEENELKELI